MNIYNMYLILYKYTHIYWAEGPMYEVDAKHSVGHNGILKENVVRYRRTARYNETSIFVSENN